MSLTEIKQFNIPIFSTSLIIGSFDSLQKLIINAMSNFKYLIKALFLVIFNILFVIKNILKVEICIILDSIVNIPIKYNLLYVIVQK